MNPETSARHWSSVLGTQVSTTVKQFLLGTTAPMERKLSSMRCHRKWWKSWNLRPECPDTIQNAQVSAEVGGGRVGGGGVEQEKGHLRPMPPSSGNLKPANPLPKEHRWGFGVKMHSCLLSPTCLLWLYFFQSFSATCSGPLPN